SIAATSFGERIHNVNEENILQYSRFISFITDWFATSDVRQLEKVATAYYITKKNPRDPAIERAKKLNALKPHVDIDAAEAAIHIVDEKRKQARSQLGETAA